MSAHERWVWFMRVMGAAACLLGVALLGLIVASAFTVWGILQGVGEVVDSANDAVQSIEEAALDQVNRLSDPIDGVVQSADDTLANANEAIKSVDDTLTSANEAVQTIEEAAASVRDAAQSLEVASDGVSELIDPMTEAVASLDDSAASVKDASVALEAASNAILGRSGR